MRAFVNLFFPKKQWHIGICPTSWEGHGKPKRNCNTFFLVCVLSAGMERAEERIEKIIRKHRNPKSRPAHPKEILPIFTRSATSLSFPRDTDYLVDGKLHIISPDENGELPCWTNVANGGIKFGDQRSIVVF